MTEWTLITLGEGLTVDHGFAFKGEHFVASGEYVVLTPGNFLESGGFKVSAQPKFYSGEFPDKHLLAKGDVVIAMTEQSPGLLGSSATIPRDRTFLHNQRLGLVRITNTQLLDLRFVYHLMNSPSVRNQIQATATGAKVRHTAPNRILAVKVPVPSVRVQRLVAAFLDSLENLIENNRRRVELLEQMAGAIYREWFVQFRYPGHDNVGMVDTPLGPIPEQWEVKRIGDVLSFRYGKGLTAASRKPGQVPVVGSGGIVGSHDESLIQGPAIVVGRKGNVGKVIWMHDACWPIDTTYYVEAELPLYYVYRQLLGAEFRNSHAAVPGLSRDQAYSLPFLLPSSDVVSMFAEVASMLGDEADHLRKQAKSLTLIRDLLLPKLVTGQIDVSDLDLNTAVESMA